MAAWPLSAVCWVGIYMCLHAQYMFAIGVNVEKYTFNDICDNSIGVDKAAGRIEFNSWTHFKWPKTSCAWKVYAKDSESRLQLNFTSFNLNGACNDANLTVWDGEYWAGPVTGMGWISCGANSTLLKQTYTSRKHFVAMKFSQTFDGIVSSKFTLVFTSFRDAPCSLTDTEAKCHNGKCIQKSLRCSGLNPCGDESDCKLFPCRDHLDCDREPTARVTIADHIFGFLKKAAPYVAGAVGLYIIFQFVQFIRGKMSSDGNSNGDDSDEVATSPANNRRNREDSEDSVPMLGHSSHTSANREQTSGTHRARNGTSHFGDPPEYSQVVTSDTNVDFTDNSRIYNASGDLRSPTNPSTSADGNGQLPPPPSYEEVMSNREKY